MALHNVGRPDHAQAGALGQFKRMSGPQASGRGRETSGPHSASREAPVEDRAEISDQARRLEDLRRTMAAGREALSREPDVRQERLAEVRQRLAGGHYDSDEVRRSLAGRLGAVLRRLETLTG
jgi:hypothetical protein